MQQSLVSFDTDKIKEYVFATGILKEIRGASDILDKLNRDAMPPCVGGTCYYAHGGSGLFLVPTEDADACIKRVRRLYAEHTGGAATITGVALPLPEYFDVERDNVQALWKRLGYKLKAAKARNPFIRASITHPLLHFGHADGTFYATRPDEDDSNRVISAASFMKRQHNSQIRLKETHPEDFAAIANASTPSNYFALIYADGDGLGQALDACPTLGEIQRVANAVDTVLRNVKKAALQRYNVAADEGDTLLHGGDDLILAVPAHKALDIALDINEGFRQGMAQELGKPYTLSVAIVWAHTTFPFSSWLDIAESTLKFAKKKGAERGHKGLLNFLVISSANHLDFKEFYARVLEEEDEKLGEWRVIRTLRPYTAQHLRLLMAYRHTLRRLPRSKLEALRQAVFQPPRRAMFEALRLLVHWRGEATRQAIRTMVLELVEEVLQGEQKTPGLPLFPFVEVKDDHDEDGRPVTTYYTPLADLAELWDFLPGGHDED